MHIYAFGSLCRGEVDALSDVDLLAVVAATDARFDSERFSIYSYAKLAQNWQSGAPFAWHLHLESRLIYSDDGCDYLSSLGRPSHYANARVDCRRFADIYASACREFYAGRSVVFELSTMFLAVRNLATCYSLHLGSKASFGRNAAVQLGEKSLQIEHIAYETLARARILSTRGLGDTLTDEAVQAVRVEEPKVQAWIAGLLSEIEKS